MISTLAAEYKAIFFKDGDEIPVVNRTTGRYLGRQVNAQPVDVMYVKLCNCRFMTEAVIG